MAYPSVITTFTNPNATDRLSSPSHSGIETAQNNALTAIMNSTGTDAAVIGTIIGDLRNASSGGGGHVQTANKGGTGQTAFTKGDILVAQSASALSKLAVGTSGQALVADSTAQTGVKWGTPNAANKIGVQTTSILTTGPTASTMYSTSIAGNKLDPTNIIKFDGIIQNISGIDSGVIILNYGGGYIASIVCSPPTNLKLSGTIQGAIVATAVSSQYSYFKVFATDTTTGNVNNTSSVWNAFTQGVSSVDTTILQSFNLVASVQGLGRTSFLSGPMIWELISG